jgi:hypothetical protein
MPLRQPAAGLDPIQLNGQLRYLGGPEIYDDFWYGSTANATFTNAWRNLASGSFNFNTANVADRPGVIQVATGAVPVSVVQLAPQQPAQPLPNGFWEFQTALSLVALSTGVTRYVGNFGMIDAGITNGFYFQYSDTVNAGNWTPTVNNAGVLTQVDSGVPAVAGAFVNLRIDGADSGAASFYINGTLVATISTGLPSNAINFQPMINLILTIGAISVAVNVDTLYYGYAFSSFR